MKNSNKKKNTVFYYTGWGMAWGTCIGTAMGIFQVEYLPTLMFLGIACGAGIGAAYGFYRKQKTNSK